VVVNSAAMDGGRDLPRGITMETLDFSLTITTTTAVIMDGGGGGRYRQGRRMWTRGSSCLQTTVTIHVEEGSGSLRRMTARRQDCWGFLGETATVTRDTMPRDTTATRDVQIITSNIPITTSNIPITTRDIQIITSNFQIITSNIPITTSNIQIIISNIPITTRDSTITRDSTTITKDSTKAPASAVASVNVHLIILRRINIIRRKPNAQNMTGQEDGVTQPMIVTVPMPDNLPSKFCLIIFFI